MSFGDIRQCARKRCATAIAHRIIACIHACSSISVESVDPRVLTACTLILTLRAAESVRL